MTDTVRSARHLSERAKAIAYGLGFDLAGVAALGAAATTPHLREWIAQGFHGEMEYMERGANLRADSTRPEQGMRSAVVVALDYGGHQPAGPIARYARGADYHDVMRARLRELHTSLENEYGGPFGARPYVDTGPILERELAQRAGLGWFGKNTMLINPKRGSFFFIGALFTSLDLAPDAPFATDHCGTCTRCLEACPTHAFSEPHVLDATKCISYMTIEHRSAIPESFRPHITESVFGCDICQDVCPWNEKFAVTASAVALAPRADLTAPDLAELLQLDDDGFRARFRGTAVTRTKRRGLARNVALAMGNSGDQRYVPALQHAAANDAEPLVREHAQWALDRLSHAAR